MSLADALLDELDDDALDRLAERLAPRLRNAIQPPQDDRWLGTGRAAEHLDCGRRRIYDLVEQGLLEPKRDGTRLLFRRTDLDAYLASNRNR